MALTEDCNRKHEENVDEEILKSVIVDKGAFYLKVAKIGCLGV